MKKTKLFIILYSFVYIFILAMTIGICISYYNNYIKDHSDIIKENKFSLLVNYDRTDNISLTNLPYNYSDSYTFKVENFSEDTIGNYKIIFEVITPVSNMIDENFVYTLTSKSISTDKSNIVVSKSETPIPIVTKELGIATITPGNTHEYTLNLKLKNIRTNYLIGKVFVSKIRIEDINN